MSGTYTFIAGLYCKYDAFTTAIYCNHTCTYSYTSGVDILYMLKARAINIAIAPPPLADVFYTCEIAQFLLEPIVELTPPHI